ncbi:MAG TPA: phosphoribosyltransferase family protein [Candidatus Paceibacterota bacterium]
MTRIYTDRAEAGCALAQVLKKYAPNRTLVLALPRGGVPVGYEVAKALQAPLDTLVVRKIGAPFNPEFAVGAIAPHEVVVFDEGSIRASGASQVSVEGMVGKEREEMRRRIDVYRSGQYSVGFTPNTVIIVDDGIATGMTARAALRAARIRYSRARIILAAPVCVPGTAEELSREADEVVCLASPLDIHAIGQAYEHFDQVSDEEVLRYLESAKKN